MLLSIQVFRGLAALLVLLFHASLIVEKSKYFDQTSIETIFHFGDAGVDFFFVLSGFIIYYVHKSWIGRKEKLPVYFWKRFIRIYPVYWIVFILLIPMVIVVKGELPSLWEMLKSFILVEHEMIVYVAWSLIHEVLFYFMFGFLILNKNLGKIIFGIWLAVILVVNIDNLFLSWFNIFGNYFTSPYNIHFFLGMFSAYLIKRKPLSYGLVLGVLGIIAFLTIGMLEVYTEILEAYNLFFGLSAFIIILGFVSREIKKPMSPPRSLLIMGDSSYSIYLVHSPVISGMAKFAVLAGITANVHVCISFLLTSVVSLAAGIVFYKFVENPLIIMLKRLKIF